MANPTSFWLMLAGLGTYIFFRTIYRLYFHPLSGIPGPKLTAATHLYEFFYNIIRPGMFLFQIEKMHQIYGPIVRISPREVHISDPSFYDEIYAPSSRKRDKDAHFVYTFGLPSSSIATVGHELHRFRRSLLDRFFSKRSVLELSTLIDERVQKLVQRLDEHRCSQSVICLDDAFSALTSDIITVYSCGKHWNFLESKKFRNDVREAIGDSTTYAHLSRFMPWLVDLSRVLPTRILSIVLPGKAVLFQFLDAFLEYSIAASQDDTSSSEMNEEGKGSVRSMITSLVDPSIPPQERSRLRLRDELYAIIGAGTETTSRTLTVASYHLSRDHKVRDTLRRELRQAMPAPTNGWTLTELEKLPYLNAVINESLRLSYGLTTRLPRVAVTETLQYKDYLIPPGTPISSSSYIIHRNESIFPDPEKFDPERWIKSAELGIPLKRYLTSFTRGSRICVGINLAYMELFLTIAHLAYRFDMELYDTSPEDVRIVSDMVVGYTRRGTMKVYAKVSEAAGECQ